MKSRNDSSVSELADSPTTATDKSFETIQTPRDGTTGSSSCTPIHENGIKVHQDQGIPSKSRENSPRKPATNGPHESSHVPRSPTATRHAGFHKQVANNKPALQQVSPWEAFDDGYCASLPGAAAAPTSLSGDAPHMADTRSLVPSQDTSALKSHRPATAPVHRRVYHRASISPPREMGSPPTHGLSPQTRAQSPRVLKRPWSTREGRRTTVTQIPILEYYSQNSSVDGQNRRASSASRAKSGGFIDARLIEAQWSNALATDDSFWDCGFLRVRTLSRTN